MTATTLTDVTLVNFDPPSAVGGALRVEDDRIAACGPSVEPHEGDEVLRLPGRVVMPGLVVGHHHLYSALARGMPAPPEPVRDFHDTLKKVWWVLDRALDRETVELSGLAGLLNAVPCGVTAVMDHHASPSCIAGSLDRLAAAFERVGVRGLLCYETSDRGGPAEARAGVEENRRFLEQSARSSMVRGLAGAHASFTLSDDSLKALAELVERTGSGIHVHLLEDPVDRDLSYERWGADPVSRLERFGLLTERALLAHGVHLTGSEMERLARASSFLAHNSRSNMNNRVGHAPLGRLEGLGVNLVMGTDGIDGDLWTEARTAFFRGREEAIPPSFGLPLKLLWGPHKILRQVFGLEFGALAPGAPADLTVVHYHPPTSMDGDNLAGHLFFGGLGPQTVESVMVAGEFIYKDRRFVRVDPKEILDRCRRAASALWGKMSQIRQADSQASNG